MTETRECAYEECSEHFTPKRPHQRFHSEPCRYAQWELEKAREGAAGTGQRVDGQAVHSLDDARGKMREGRTSAQWELVAREKVARTLLDTGEFTDDDLFDLNVPVHYRKHVHGAATGHYSGEEPYMEFVELRKSRRPSRKGGKNQVFRINAKGRRELPKKLRDLRTELQQLIGSCADTPGGVQGAGSPASSRPVPHVGAASSQNVGHDTGGDGESGDSSDALGVVSGDSTIGAGQVSGKRDQGGSHSSSVAGTDAPDSLVALDSPRKASASSMYDPMEDAA